MPDPKLVPVVTKSGKVGYLPADIAAEAGDAVRPATDAELRAAQVEANKGATEKALRDKYDNGGLMKAIEGAVAPAAAGAARGLTLGGSDQAITGLARTLGGEEGAQEAADKLTEYRDYAPVTSAVGELGAIAGASLMGDEAGLGAVPGAIGRLGEAVGGRTASALGGGLLARGAGTLARGAVEGGIYGMGNAVSEAALSNKDLTSEALIANGVHGAAFGAALSGGLGALGAGAGRVADAFGGLRPKASAFEAIAKNEFGEAAPGIGEKLAAEQAPTRPTMRAEVGAREPRVIYAGPSGTSDVGAFARRIANGERMESAADLQFYQNNAKAIEAELARMANPAAGGPYRTAPEGGAADLAARGAIKVSAAGDASKAEELGNIWKNRAVTLKNAEDTLEGHSRSFSKALDEQIQAGRQVDIASFGDAKTTQMAKLVDASKVAEQQSAMTDFVGKTMGIVDQLRGDAASGLGPSAVKRLGAQMGKLTKAIESGDSLEMFTHADQLKRFLGKESGFGRSKFGQSLAEKEFDGLYHDLMSRLESEGTWGKAGLAQKDVNAATARMLSEGKLFSRKFTTEFGSEAGHPLYAADTSAVSGLMGRLTSAANDLDAKGVRSYIEARRQFLDAVSKNYSFKEGVSGAIARERKALDTLEGTFKRASDEVTLINQTKRLQAEEHAAGIGGLVGAAMDVASRPVTTLRRLAQLETMTQNVVGKASKGVRKIVGSAEPAAPQDLAPPKKAGFFSSLLQAAPVARAGKAVRSTAMAAGSSRARFQALADGLAAYQSNPAALTDKIGSAVAPYADHAPRVTAGATATAMRGMAYLASILPDSRVDTFSLQPQLHQRSMASEADIARFMRAKEALDNPAIIVDEARKGTLTKDHVDAVKAVYPNIYEAVRQQAMKSLIDSKSPLPYSARIQLGILLDIPTDRTLSPDFVSAVQATYSASEKAGEEPPHPNLSSLDLGATSLETATQMAGKEGTER